MPRKDLIHNPVKNALIKDGWTITHDPFGLDYGTEDLYLDLGAERILAAERGAERIAVEIKSFVGVSTITELYSALGQYQVYLAILEAVEPDRKLYLAVSKTAYDVLTAMDTFTLIVKRYSVSLIVVRIAEEEIDQWKP